MLDKVSYSLFVQNTPEYGYELSDIGIDWAIETELNIPIGVDPEKYFENQINGFSDLVKNLMKEYWNSQRGI